MQIFATLSPIPGFMQWLLAKLASQIKLAETELQEGNSLEGAGSTFRESILLPEEEKLIQNSVYVLFQEKSGKFHLAQFQFQFMFSSSDFVCFVIFFIFIPINLHVRENTHESVIFLLSFRLRFSK